MNATTIARLISILAHPFVMVALMVLSAGIRGNSVSNTISSLVLVAIFTIVPVAVLIVRKVRTGQWDTVDASRPKDRPALFTVALLALAILLLYLLVRNPGSFLIRGTAGAFGLLLAASLLNRWVKASLHMAFASFAATLLLMIGSSLGWIVLAVLPLLAWSRLQLKRHLPVEVVAGTLLGIAAALAIRFA